MMGRAGNKIIFLLIVIFSAAFFANAVKTTPGIIEIGDKLSFEIPVVNDAANTVDLRDIEPEIVSSPPWLTLLNTSIRALAMLPPGESISFRLDFEVNSLLPAGSPAANIVIKLKTTTQNLNSPLCVWHFRTSNGFVTSSRECVDGQGNSFGGSLSPDETPPTTTLLFTGPIFTDTQGKLFIASHAAIVLDAVDAIIEDAVTADINFIGFKLNQQAVSLKDLNAFVSSFTLPAGSHFIVFASSDNAGNAEELKTLCCQVPNATFLFPDLLTDPASLGLISHSSYSFHS